MTYPLGQLSKSSTEPPVSVVPPLDRMEQAVCDLKHTFSMRHVCADRLSHVCRVQDSGDLDLCKSSGVVFETSLLLPPRDLKRRDVRSRMNLHRRLKGSETEEQVREVWPRPVGLE